MKLFQGTCLESLKKKKKKKEQQACLSGIMPVSPWRLKETGFLHWWTSCSGQGARQWAGGQTDMVRV